MDSQGLTEGRERYGGLRHVHGPGSGAAGCMGGMVLLGIGYLADYGRVVVSIRNTRKARMNMVMDIMFKLIDGKRMIDELDRAQSFFESFYNGIPKIGISDDAFLLAGEISGKAFIITKLYMSALINMIYATGMTDSRLPESDLYDFLRGYTGEMDKRAGQSAHENSIRKLGSDWRKKHDEQLKKEQTK